MLNRCGEEEKVEAQKGGNEFVMLVARGAIIERLKVVAALYFGKT